MLYKLRKIGLFLFSISSFIGLSLVFGQDNSGMIISSDSSGNKIVNTKIKPEAMEYKEDIRESATVRFCNDGKIQKDMISNIKPGESKEFCLYLKNDSNQNVSYDVEFIGGYTDKDGFRFCLLTEDPGDFPKFVEKTWKDKIYVKKKSNVIKKFNVKFPIGVKGGMHQGCVGYSIEGTDFQASSMINLRFRKVNYLDFLVGGESVIESVVNLEGLNVNFDKNTNKLSVAGGIKNDGSLDQIVDITGVIYNMFGYKKEFSFLGIKLPVGTLKEFNTKDIENTLDTTIPFYKGLFNVELTVNHKPYFSFDVANAGIDQKILEGGSVVKKTSIFLLPWTIIGMVVIFLFLLRFAFFKKPKVVYIEKNNQNLK